MFKFKPNLSKLKYLTIGIIIGSLLSVSAVQATNTVKLIVNGEDITYKSDVPPQIINGRTLVPARALAESLGASVEWDEGNRAVVVRGNGYMASQEKINLSTNNNKPPQAILNNIQTIEKNGEVFFLLSDYENSFYKEGINYIQWDGKSNFVLLIINSQIIANLPFEIINNRTYINIKYYVETTQTQQ